MLNGFALLPAAGFSCFCLFARLPNVKPVCVVGCGFAMSNQENKTVQSISIC